MNTRPPNAREIESIENLFTLLAKGANALLKSQAVDCILAGTPMVHDAELGPCLVLGLHVPDEVRFDDMTGTGEVLVNVLAWSGPQTVRLSSLRPWPHSAPGMRSKWRLLTTAGLGVSGSIDESDCKHGV